MQRIMRYVLAIRVYNAYPYKVLHFIVQQNLYINNTMVTAQGCRPERRTFQTDVIADDGAVCALTRKDAFREGPDTIPWRR